MIKFLILKSYSFFFMCLSFIGHQVQQCPLQIKKMITLKKINQYTVCLFGHFAFFK